MRLALFVLLMAAALQSRDWPEVASGPSVIHKADPDYTREALDAKLQGTVVLNVKVLEDGTASDIKVVRGLGKGLDEKAVECVRKWRFKPGTRWGKAVASYATIEIAFHLPRERADV
jgi:TonB family protein